MRDEKFNCLFFDDQHLFIRSNVVRDYTCPTKIGEFYQNGLSHDFPFAEAFKMEDGTIRLLYNGHDKEEKSGYFVATSKDGIHFEPLDTTKILDIDGRIASNQFWKCEPGDEIACIIDDPDKHIGSRFIMLMTYLRQEKVFIDGVVYTSNDLINWTEIKGQMWNDGCEPVTGAFYNKKRGCFTIIRRPFWSDRRVMITETNDFIHFTKAERLMQVDSLDQPLDEIYGMVPFDNGDMFIGFPVVFSNIRPCRSAKSAPGSIYPQLAYSFDGAHWQRSLRKTFLSSYTGLDELYFPGNILRLDNGDMLLYTIESPAPHGIAFHGFAGGKIGIYKIQKDRFVELRTQDNAPSVITTRHALWNGGDIHINLKAEHATCAVLDYYGYKIEGFYHSDCEPFSGDKTDWTPRFKGGTLDQFIGKPVIVEVRLTNGAIWSISANCYQMMEEEAQRCVELGPDRAFFDEARDR